MFGVSVIINKAEQLKASDLDGQSDPYIVVECFDSKQQSRVVSSNRVNPSWNQRFDFSKELPSGEVPELVTLTILDHVCTHCLKKR
jgi:hypothetical protein